VTRALILGASLLALAACSTEGNLLAPDREADRLISPESRSDYEERGVDPVCGATLDDEHDVWHANYGGVRYAFHSEACRKQFLQNPELYSATVR
jgi:YHS domain-containing protein